MAVHSIEVPIEISDIDDEIVETEGDALAHAAQINFGAFRGLAYALAIEATVVGLAGLGLALLRMLR